MNNIAIKKSYKRAIGNPALYWSELVNLDRVLDRKIVFSKVGSNFDFNNFSFIDNSLFYTKYHTLKKVEDINNHKERLLSAFEKAEGVELVALNLLCANFLKYKYVSDVGYCYFLNRYFSFFLQGKIYLKDNDKAVDNIFNRLGYEPACKTSENSDLVTVIMPAFNNQSTVGYAASSILNQTHSNVELIIVDDCSSDDTYKVCKKIENKDKRVKVIKNNKNSGAYISRNNALRLANGKYVTVLDADDWSFPDRLSYQLSRLKKEKKIAHLGYYLRLTETGYVTSFRIKGKYSFDGAQHKCLASLMVEKKFLDSNLGFWDSVRFGADSEMYNRILSVKEAGIIEDVVPLMLALDREDSLTRKPESALGNKIRSEYAKSFTEWHKKIQSGNARIDFPIKRRPFNIPQGMS